ncbi:MAG: hypothetical protein M3419_11525 [Actinomycetota bacterium]|nr:hypothetical protein [Actinomycetota bacterium]
MSASEDDMVWDDLVAMWQDADPVPADLAERVLVALAINDIDAEYAMLHLVERSTELAGTRGEDAAVTISFAAGDVTVTVHVSTLAEDRRRLDGWVTTAGARGLDVVQPGHQVHVNIDEGGRFAVSDLAAGPTRLIFDLGDADADGGPQTFATPVVEL